MIFLGTMDLDRARQSKLVALLLSQRAMNYMLRICQVVENMWFSITDLKLAREGICTIKQTKLQ